MTEPQLTETPMQPEASGSEPAPALPESPGPVAATRPTPTATARPRPKAEPRRPLHLAVAIGLSAGAYSAALAGVTALQSSSEQALAADQTPTSSLVLQLKAQNSDLAARIAKTTATYNKAAAAYTKMATGIGTFEQTLGALAQQVAIAENIASSPVAGVRRPAAGGGGTTASSGGGAAAPAQVVPIAPIPAAPRAAPPPPPVQTTTCASGKPCP